MRFGGGPSNVREGADNVIPWLASIFDRETFRKP